MNIDELARLMGKTRRQVEAELKSSDVIELDLNKDDCYADDNYHKLKSKDSEDKIKIMY